MEGVKDLPPFRPELSDHRAKLLADVFLLRSGGIASRG